MARPKKEAKKEVVKMTDREAKELAVKTAIKEINKEFGDGSVMTLDSQPLQMDFYPTGIIPLDIAIGIGGIPKGRIVEIYGPESSGKTTITLKIIAETQKRGGICGFIDAENALNLQHAKTIGVNIKELQFSQPTCGEDALAIVEKMVLSSGFDLIVVDSVSALVPRAELDGQMGDNAVGLQARLMSKAMRKLAGIASKSGTTIIFINQLREKIGVMYGNPETTTGGRALKFYSSVRLDVRRKETLKKGTEEVGIKVNVKVAKNKVAPPFRTATFEISFTDGIPEESFILSQAVDLDIVNKTGAWYSYKGDKIGQGEENSKEFLKNNKDIYREIKKAVFEYLGYEYNDFDDTTEDNTTLSCEKEETNIDED